MIKQDNYQYGTHLPALIEYVLRTSGPIIEVGAGHYSTPIIELFNHDRQVIHVEPDCAYHWDKGIWFSNVIEALAFGPFSVALIDGPTDTRREAFDLLVDKTEYCVLHDTEDPIYNYGLDRFTNTVNSPFRTVTFSRLNPQTTVVWNRRITFSKGR